MKKITFLYLAIIISIASCKKSSSDEETAPVSIEKKNRAILLDFSEDWCPPCGAYGGPSFDSCLSIESSTITCMKVYSSSNNSSLNSSFSSAINTDYNVTGVPDFYVNGTELNAGGGVYSDIAANFNWVKGKATAFAGQTVEAGVDLKQSIKTGVMTVTSTVQFFNPQAAGKDFRLAIYVVEDDIVSAQQVTGQGSVSTYVHHNLLRTSNSVTYKGDALNSSAAITADTRYSKSYSINLNPAWVTSKLKVIGVIWDATAAGKPTVVNTNMIN